MHVHAMSRLVFPVPAVASLSDDLLRVEVRAELRGVRLLKYVLTIDGDTYVTNGPEQPLPVACWIVGADEKLRALTPQPLDELVHGLELRVGEALVIEIKAFNPFNARRKQPVLLSAGCMGTAL